MRPTTLRIDPQAPDPAIIQQAAELLRRGGLVAFPTETVYGLGSNALDPEAVQRIFQAKGRPGYNPLIVHVSDARSARALSREWPIAAERLAAAFWPGPLTMVLPKREVVPDVVTAGLPSVALRVPEHPVALALLRAAGIPIAAPSANPSSGLSPTTAEHVLRSMGARVDLILDAGPAPIGIESTVVDLTGLRPAILRPGLLSAARVEACIGPLVEPERAAGDTSRPSPGMLERHYSPRAELRIVSSANEAIRLLADARAAGQRSGAILREFPDLAADQVVRLPADAAGYARDLYAALHRLDGAKCELVVVERVPEEPEWDGVRDRLARAATR